MNKGFDPADLRRVLEAHAAFPDNDSAAARSIGVDRNTFRNRLSKAKADPSLASGPKPDPIEIRNLEFWKTKARQAEKRLADAEHTLRELAGMTQRQLADAIGTAPEVISRMEHGTYGPSLERIDEIARALGIAPRDLLDFEESAEGGASARLAAILHRLSPEDVRLVIGLAELVARERSAK